MSLTQQCKSLNAVDLMYLFHKVNGEKKRRGKTSEND